MTAGRPRILVTRPRTDGEDTARRLAAMGCEAVLAPVLEIVPVDLTADPDAPDVLVATSANAFAGPTPASWLDLPVFVVGDATAAAARAAGFERVHGGGGDAATLADTLLRDTAPDVRLLLLAGRPRKPELERALAARRLQVVERYEARAVGWTGSTATALKRRPPLAALHFSRRSATLAGVAAAAAGLADLFAAMKHVCLSADVAAGLPCTPGNAPIVAMRPDTDSLLQALVATLA